MFKSSSKFEKDSLNHCTTVLKASKANFMKIMLKIHFLIIFSISEIEQVEEQGARRPWPSLDPIWTGFVLDLDPMLPKTTKNSLSLQTRPES
jgi:hypothetical protein